MAGNLYNNIGGGYDTTRRSDPYISSRLAHHLGIYPSGRYLDIACGTGNYTTALAALGGRWIGLDSSTRMLNRAKAKSQTPVWHCAHVQNLPYRAGSFSGVTCVLGVHHFASLSTAFCETHRVLSRGRFVMFTSTREQMHHYWLAEYFPEAIRRSIEQMPALSSLQSALSTAGFAVDDIEPYEVRDDLQDLFLYCGKRRPALYLDDGVRRGISTFASLADPNEIVEGLARLWYDIESQRFVKVQEKYPCSGGDYCFITASKVQED